MPISAEKMRHYPGGSIYSKEWKAFRAFILFRAANRCEGTPQNPECRARNYEKHPDTGSKVILTIAHMDHDESHADPYRCRALCQRCHNQWDAKQRRFNAERSRARKVGQSEMDLADEQMASEQDCHQGNL